MVNLLIIIYVILCYKSHHQYLEESSVETPSVSRMLLKSSRAIIPDLGFNVLSSIPGLLLMSKERLIHYHKYGNCLVTITCLMCCCCF